LSYGSEVVRRSLSRTLIWTKYLCSGKISRCFAAYQFFKAELVLPTRVFEKLRGEI
jgi:hypothetical protein